MATRRTTKPHVPQAPLEILVSRDEAKARLQERIEKGLELKQRRVGTRDEFDLLSNDYSKWNAFNSELLKRIFTNDELAKEYSFWGAMAISMREPSLGEKIADVYKDVDKKIHRLDSIIERLELIPLSMAAQSAAPTQQEVLPSQPRTKKVFVVHGRDEIAKTNLEVFMHEIGLEPVVLHRQADEGMTIIEKFEKHSEVGYAFILLTPTRSPILSRRKANPMRNVKRSSEPARMLSLSSVTSLENLAAPVFAAFTRATYLFQVMLAA